MPIGGIFGRFKSEVDPVAQRRLDIAKRNALSRFKALPRDVMVQPGEGENFAEFFPANELFNPNPGVPTVEVRPKGMKAKGRALENIVAGDLLHDAAERDPKFKELKNEFIESLSGRQKDFAKRRYQHDVERGERRSFDEWFENVWSDALIRGFITPDENDEFRGTYSGEEKEALRKIEKHLMSSGGR